MQLCLSRKKIRSFRSIIIIEINAFKIFPRFRNGDYFYINLFFLLSLSLSSKQTIVLQRERERESFKLGTISNL